MKMIEQLIKRYNLGDITGDILPVSGGLMHKMFKVQTSTGIYAVKCLNPQIMKRPGVMENYKKAEALERILADNRIPIVPALTFDGEKILELDGGYYYIFKWQKGQITDWDSISSERCYKAGEILGNIHRIDSQNIEAEEIELSSIDFKDYLDSARKLNSSIVAVLEDNLELLKNSQEKLNEARRRLPSLRAICDDDMDPKNIMWDEGKAYVIDLECLDYGNPVSSCFNLSLQWSGTVNERFEKENLAAFYKGYLKAYDNGFRSYDKLYGIAYTWVEWLEYNIRRALGMEGKEEEEIKLGVEETIRTIDRIRYLNSIEDDICSVLKNLHVWNTLYVSDLDGTLMRNDCTLSQNTIRTINELTEKGLAFTFATARSIESARTITGELRLKLPVITRNGAVLADNTTGKHIEKALFTAEEVEMLKALLPELPKYGFVSCFLGEVMHRLYIDGDHVPALQGYIDYYTDNPTVRPVATIPELFCGEPGYVTLMGSKEEISPIYDRVREYDGWESLFQKDTYRDEYWLEICPQNCTKAKTITKVKERFGFSRLVVFGDGLNDIPMFNVADESYAVANALEEVKRIATGVIGSNEEDAVAGFLKKRMEIQ